MACLYCQMPTTITNIYYTKMFSVLIFTSHSNTYVLWIFSLERQEFSLKLEKCIHLRKFLWSRSAWRTQIFWETLSDGWSILRAIFRRVITTSFLSQILIHTFLEYIYSTFYEPLSEISWTSMSKRKFWTFSIKK